MKVFISELLKQATHEYYRFWSVRTLSALNGVEVISYAQSVEKILASEDKRVFNYLHMNSRRKVSRVCLLECIYEHRDRILDMLKELLLDIYDNSQVP